jgi:hypothetical protein
MQWGESPRQVAEGADVTFSMVTNTAALHEVFNGHDGILTTLVKGSPPDFRDPMTRSLGHFADAQMPPSSQLPMEGYRGSNIVGISLKMLVDQMLERTT